MINKDRLYITLNRAGEWKRCLLYNLKIVENRIVSDISTKSSVNTSSSAIMITGSVDSAEHDFKWSNMLIDAELGENMIVRVSAFSSNTTVVTLDDRVIELDSFIADNSQQADERAAVIDTLFKPLFSDCTDGLINMSGRYIWLKIDFIMLDECVCAVNKIKLLLSGEKMMNYLPEIYKTEDGECGFMSRYMSIFDSIFFEMDRSIDKLGRNFDYRAATGELLRYLAEWVCVDDAAYLSDDRLRKKIADTVSVHRMIGVKRGLVRWIENEYGVIPNIIEYFSVQKMIYEGKDREIYKRLFGTNPYKFFIILPENVFSDTHEANHFMEKLKKNIPAYAEAEVIIAKKNIILEKHTYLGVNSFIGGYVQGNTDAGNQITRDIILGGSDNEQH